MVRVWYAAGEEPAAVERRVESATPSSALAELVRGPTAAERERGLTSWWSDETAGVVGSVTESDGRLVVDFRDLPRLIPNASSSAGSTQLLTSLDSTLFQFEDVEAVEYRLEGSCDAFWNWLQRDCTVVRR